MDQLLTSVTGLVKGALDTAGDLAGTAAEGAMDAATAVLAQYQKTYEAYLATGMTPEDAADAAERYLRNVYGITVI